MKTEFYNLLIHPEYKYSLNYDEGKNVLTNEDNDVIFKIIDEIFVLLPQGKKTKQTKLHTKHETSFEYVKHYETDAEVFDYFENTNDKLVHAEEERLHQAILKNIQNQDWILDVGCGKAWLAGELCKQGKNVVSMDISKTNPIKALKNCPYKNHHGIVADVYHLPFKTATFETIVASEIIEHVPDPKLFIEKLMEVLKPNGQLIISTPYNEKIEYSLCVHCNKPTPKNAHIHSFNETNIKLYLPDPRQFQYQGKIKLINNSILAKLRIQKILIFLPYHLWKALDTIANSLIKKPLRLLLIIKKSAKS